MAQDQLAPKIGIGDSLFLATWTNNSALSDGPAMPIINPLAASTASKDKNTLGLRQKTYENSSSSLGLLPAHVFNDTSLLKTLNNPALQGRQTDKSLESNASLSSAFSIVDVKVDQGELDDLVAGFNDSDSSAEHLSPTKNVDTLVDSEKTLCPAFQNVRRHLDSLTKVTDTVYKQRSRIPLSMTNQKELPNKSFDGQRSVDNDSGPFANQVRQVCSEEFISDMNQIQSILKADEANCSNSVLTLQNTSFSGNVPNIADDVSIIDAYLKERCASPSFGSAFGQKPDTWESMPSTFGDVSKDQVPVEKQTKCAIVISEPPESLTSSAKITNNSGDVENMPNSNDRMEIENHFLSLQSLSNDTYGNATLSPCARELLRRVTFQKNTTMLADLLLQVKHTLNKNPANQSTVEEGEVAVQVTEEEKSSHRLSTQCAIPGRLWLKGPSCITFGCVKVGEKSYYDIPLDNYDKKCRFTCKFYVKQSGNCFQVENREAGSELLFDRDMGQTLTISFKPNRVGFMSAKIVFLIKNGNQDGKIRLKGWGGQASISLRGDLRYGHSRPSTMNMSMIPCGHVGQYKGRFSIVNTGTLAAFVKLFSYKNSLMESPLTSDEINIEPSNWVLLPSERQAVDIKVNFGTHPSLDTLVIAVMSGEEIIRRNLRAAEMRKGKKFFLRDGTFSENFNGENRCVMHDEDFVGTGEGPLFMASLQTIVVRLMINQGSFGITRSNASIDVNDTTLQFVERP